MSDPAYVSNWRLNVVVVVKYPKRKHIPLHMEMHNTRRCVAVAMQDRVSTVGFTHGGERFFPDQIESITLTDLEHEDNGE